MIKDLIISAGGLEKKIALLEDDQVAQLFIERDAVGTILGNVYKGRVVRVLPGMQAAFVDIGLDQNAFLYLGDFFEDYEELSELVGSAEFDTAELPEPPSEERAPAEEKKKRRRKRASNKRAAAEEQAAELEADAARVSETAEGAAAEAAAPSGGAPGKEPAAAGADPSPVVTPAEPAPPVIPPPAPPEPWEGPTILPPSLAGVASRGKPTFSAGSDAGLPAILPEMLKTPPAPAGTGRRRKKTAKVVVAEQPAIEAFARPRGGGRSRSRSGSRASDGNGNAMLKAGREILVQVTKESIGRKGPRVTSHIVLPGRFIVFMPTVQHVGVSRRIESARERQRLRQIVMELRGEMECGFIVRTAGEGKSREELKQDMMYLTRLWDQIRKRAEQASAPALLHADLGLVERILRDYLTDEFRSVRVDDEDEYQKIVEFVSSFNPELVERIRLYSGKLPIFDAFNITPEIERALKSKVWLASGGYIVINQTEALVAIDVNTGKYVGRTSSLEDTIAKTNLDAVREVVRQIRLRDLGGIIIVDFIDMDDPRNRKKVWEALQAELKKDKAPSKVLPFNEFGLVAITRKRVRQSLERTLCQSCYYCEGTGLTKSIRTVAISIYEEVRRILSSLKKGSGELIIRCHPDVAQGLKTSEQRVRDAIQSLVGRKVTVVGDPLLHIEKFDLVEA
ncbi:MAG: hypothetical protein Kow00109_28140 [Acidobacteriota bacterium]